MPVDTILVGLRCGVWSRLRCPTISMWGVYNSQCNGKPNQDAAGVLVLDFQRVDFSVAL